MYFQALRNERGGILLLVLTSKKTTMVAPQLVIGNYY